MSHTARTVMTTMAAACRRAEPQACMTRSRQHVGFLLAVRRRHRRRRRRRAMRCSRRWWLSRSWSSAGGPATRRLPPLPPPTVAWTTPGPGWRSAGQPHARRRLLSLYGACRQAHLPHACETCALVRAIEQNIEQYYTICHSRACCWRASQGALLGGRLRLFRRLLRPHCRRNLGDCDTSAAPAQELL